MTLLAPRSDLCSPSSRQVSCFHIFKKYFNYVYVSVGAYVHMCVSTQEVKRGYRVPQS